MCYCNTSEHNDRQRGNTPSAVRFAEAHKTALMFRTDILFQISLVAINGALAIPVSVHPAAIPYSLVDCHHRSNVGLLDGVVCGLKNGSILFASGPVEGTKECELLSCSRAVEMARAKPFPQFPTKWIGIGWDQPERKTHSIGTWCQSER